MVRHVVGRQHMLQRLPQKECTEKPRQYHCTGWKKKRNDVPDEGKVVKGRMEVAGWSHVVPRSQPR